MSITSASKGKMSTPDSIKEKSTRGKREEEDTKIRKDEKTFTGTQSKTISSGRNNFPRIRGKGSPIKEKNVKKKSPINTTIQMSKTNKEGRRVGAKGN